MTDLDALPQHFNICCFVAVT